MNIIKYLHEFDEKFKHIFLSDFSTELLVIFSRFRALELL